MIRKVGPDEAIVYSSLSDLQMPFHFQTVQLNNYLQLIFCLTEFHSQIFQVLSGTTFTTSHSFMQH